MGYLKLLGGSVLQDDDGGMPPVASHRHAIALLSLLACAPERQLSRSKVAGTLWPRWPEHTARNRLNTYVHRIRSELGRDVLVSVGDSLRLNRDALDCDVCRFHDALEAGDWSSGAELYQGPFLDGFRIDDSPAFEKWADLEAEKLRRSHREATERLAESAERRGERRVAARLWQELAWEDPYDSRIAARLVETLAATGNRAGALRAGREHVERMEEEFGVSADPEVEAALRRVEAGQPSRKADKEAGSVAPTLDHRAVAVLPFENLGGGDEAEALADGVHNDLLTRLSRVRTITVISRTSVLRYRGTRSSIPEIAAELGVGTVVEGAVQQAGDRLRLHVQLIDGRTDVHRWADTFDSAFTAESLFDIQGELAGRIAENLSAHLTPGERERATAWAPTRDMEAYRFQALARSRLDERTERGMRGALVYFRQAVDRDPRYALAWVGLADTLTLLKDYGFEPPETVLPEAEQATHRALDLDPELAEAHASAGLLASVRRDGPEALRRLGRAVEIQPAYAEAHNWLSWVSNLLGRFDAALDHGERAVELDPLSPEAASNLALSCLTTGDIERALREARRVRELQEDWTTGPFLEALALFRSGRIEDADRVLDGLAVAWTGAGAEATLGLVRIAAGHTRAARATIAELERGGHAFAAGLLHLALGDHVAAFNRFQTAPLGEHWPTLAIRSFYPDVWDRVHDEGRYQTLLQRVNRAWGLAPDGTAPSSSLRSTSP